MKIQIGCRCNKHWAFSIWLVCTCSLDILLMLKENETVFSFKSSLTLLLRLANQCHLRFYQMYGKYSFCFDNRDIPPVKVAFHMGLTRSGRLKYSPIYVQKQRLRASGRRIDHLESIYEWYYHPRAGWLRSCSRRQVAGWWLAPAVRLRLSSREMAAPARPLLAALLLLGAALAVQVISVWGGKYFLRCSIFEIQQLDITFGFRRSFPKSEPHLSQSYAFNTLWSGTIAWSPVGQDQTALFYGFNNYGLSKSGMHVPQITLQFLINILRWSSWTLETNGWGLNENKQGWVGGDKAGGCERGAVGISGHPIGKACQPLGCQPHPHPPALAHPTIPKNNKHDPILCA